MSAVPSSQLTKKAKLAAALKRNMARRKQTASSAPPTLSQKAAGEQNADRQEASSNRTDRA